MRKNGSELRRLGGRDGSVDKVPVMQAQGPEFRTSTFNVKIHVWQFMSVTPALGYRDRQILEAHWPANLTKIVNSRLGERSCLKT